MHYYCFLLHFTAGEDGILINPFAGGSPLLVASLSLALFSCTVLLKCVPTFLFPHSCVIPISSNLHALISTETALAKVVSDLWISQAFLMSQGSEPLLILLSLPKMLFDKSCLSLNSHWKEHLLKTMLVTAHAPKPFPDWVKYPLHHHCTPYMIPS